MPFVELPELKIHYDQAGDGPRAVLLVHGNFASGRWWRPVLDRAPAGLALYAPSLRGCGQSGSPPCGYDLGQLARDLEGFARALGLDRFALVGHSLGGAVATQYAVDHPERVESLLLVAPAPTAGLAALRDSSSALARLLRSVDADDPASLLSLGTMLRWGRALGTTRRFLRRGLEQLLGAAPLSPGEFDQLLSDAARIEPEAILGFLAALQQWDPRPGLGRVTAPVRVVWGEHDRLIPREAAEATARDFPRGAFVHWSGVGHSPMLESPEAFASFLFAFARGEEPAPAPSPPSLEPAAP